MFLVTLLAADLLLRPVYRRLGTPRWAEALRHRRRGRVIGAAWLLTLLLLLVFWLIGEQRGWLNLLMLMLWVGVPLAALRLTLYLRRG